MLSFLQRHRGPVIVAVLLVLPLLFLYAQTRRQGARGPVVGVLVDVSSVVERGLLFVVGGVQDTIEHYVTSVDAWEELVRLRRERVSATMLRARVVELEHENEELRALARAAVDIDGPRPLGAHVIARTGAPLSRLITLDRGRRDGVRRGDGVLGRDGVAAVVLAVGRTSSDALLISDASAAIDVIDQRTRARGLLRGDGDADHYSVVVEDFDRLSDVRIGDVIVTSGTGARFPTGIPIGVVEKLDKRDDSLTMTAWIKPAVDLARLELVEILIDRPTPRAPELGSEASLPAASSAPSTPAPVDAATTKPGDAKGVKRKGVDVAVTKPDASKPDASKPEASKPDASKPDASKPDASKPDPAAVPSTTTAPTPATSGDVSTGAAAPKPKADESPKKKRKKKKAGAAAPASGTPP